jgi:hypothetical protein
MHESSKHANGFQQYELYNLNALTTFDIANYAPGCYLIPIWKRHGNLPWHDRCRQSSGHVHQPLLCHHLMAKKLGATNEV